MTNNVLRKVGDAVMKESGRGHLADEPAALMVTSALCAEIASQSSVGAVRESEDSFTNFDDEFDYPSTAYPARELFTFGLFVLAIITFTVWAGLNLISLVLNSLI